MLELLIVMVIAGMLTSFGVSRWHHYQQTLKLEQTAQQLLAFLTRLQSDANWHNRNALLWFRTGETWCIGSGTPLASCHTQTHGVFRPEHAGITLLDFTQKEIGFYGIRNSAQAGHILLGNSAGRIRIVISAKSRIRLCSEDDTMRNIALCQP